VRYLCGSRSFCSFLYDLSLIAANLDSDQSVCNVYLDVNECTDLSRADDPPCAPGTVCVNVPGSYRCSDPSNVGCTDVDPVTGQCVDVRPGFCQPGMTYDSTTGKCVGKREP